MNGQEAIYTEKVMMEAFVLPGEDFAFAKAPLLSHAFAQGTYYYYEIAEEGDYHYTYGEETYHFYLDLSEPEVIMTPDLNDLELVFFQDNRYLYKESGPLPQGTLTLFWQDPVLAAFGYPEGCYETTIQLEEGVNDPAEVLPFGYLDLSVFEVDTEAPQIVDWQEGTTLCFSSESANDQRGQFGSRGELFKGKRYRLFRAAIAPARSVCRCLSG